MDREGSGEMKMKKLSHLDVNYHPCEKIFCPNMNFMDKNLDINLIILPIEDLKF
jgi:hypothetical protein